jgi:membrane protease YdiL (CAAX protease family)
VERHIAGLLGDVAGDEIFALAVISGIAEEIFFRGAVQGSWGWLVATALFALLHTGPSRAFRLWTLFALVAGVLFAVLTLATGNLLAAIVAHAGVNGVNLRSVAKRRSALQSADHEPDPDDSRP